MEKSLRSLISTSGKQETTLDFYAVIYCISDSVAVSMNG
jgi:hypothetical protein